MIFSWKSMSVGKYSWEMGDFGLQIPHFPSRSSIPPLSDFDFSSLISSFAISSSSISSSEVFPRRRDESDGSTEEDSEGHHSSHFPYEWILGSMGVALVLIFCAVIKYVSFKSRICCKQIPGSHGKDPDRRISHKFQILQRPNFYCGSRQYLCCKSGKWNPANGDAACHQIDIRVPKDVLDVEKPIVFSYEDIFFSIDGFSDANLLGHGNYGSVYYGVLHDQEVAIKRMTATKTKEFMAEMKVLCKVHHMNSVELIDYAATDDELFLIYEFAQKGSLKSHLHDPRNKGGDFAHARTYIIF